MITIFTPTYNRKNYLKKLYGSLICQTNKNFEWLIVDDGSIDDTEGFISELSKQNKIKITYFNQNNQGKHIAINKGLELATTEYFFIVDSDDMLTPDGIETIYKNIHFIANDEKKCGLIFNRIYENGQTIGGANNYDTITCSLFDLKFKYHLNSDKAEIFKTKILKQFLFPQFQGEKFAPEALVMFRMSGPYSIVYINKGIYIGEYLEGGLTSNITKIRMRSPKATTLYYYEQFERTQNFYEKMKSAINFYRFRFNNYRSIKLSLPGFYILTKPIGWLFFLKDKRLYDNI